MLKGVKMQNENVEANNIPEYDFDIIEMIKEGFNRIEGVKGLFLVAFFVYVVVFIYTSMLLCFIVFTHGSLLAKFHDRPMARS